MIKSFLPGRMRHLGTPAVAIALIASLNSTFVHAADSSDPVTVYQHVNFNGLTHSTGEGDVSIATLRGSVGNDRISSVSVMPGYEVLACRNSRLRGRCEIFTRDVSDLRDISFNDVISSLRISRSADLSPVTVYQHVNFRGRSLDIQQDSVITIQDLRDMGPGNDVISSIRVADGYAVEACEHSRDNGSGACRTFTDSISDLRTIRFNDLISYLSVVRVADESPAENTPPIASDVFFDTRADTVLEFTLADLVRQGGISDPDNNDLLTISVPANNIVTPGNDDSFSYDPTADFGTLAAGVIETVSFPYEVTDETATVVRTVTIRVEGIVPEEEVYTLGATGPGGGTVFLLFNEDGFSSIDGNPVTIGTSGLEFAPDVTDSVAWGCGETDLAGIPNLVNFEGASVTDPGDQLVPLQAVQSGSLNRSVFTDPKGDVTGPEGVICNSPAAGAALAYINTASIDGEAAGEVFDDWYLPSITELLEIYRTGFLIPTVMGEFEPITPVLWSSTEHTAQNVWFLLRNGVASNGDKDIESSFHVLPVRSF